MIQRIQTVYLLLALVLTVVCLCMPVGVFHTPEMGGDVEMYNLWTLSPDNGIEYRVWPLFVALIISCTNCVLAIFSFKNRKLQLTICKLNQLLVVIWVALLLFFVKTGDAANMAFTPSYYVFLLIVVLFLYQCAVRGIKKDDKLIKDMDRLR